MTDYKTPFQIRLETIQEARQILMDSFFPKQERAMALFDNYLSNGDIPNAKQVEFPTVPTLEEIMTTAGTLRKFIDSQSL